MSEAKNDESEFSALLYFKRFTALMLDGWSVSTTYLYDGEGVDGWRWEDAAGNDYYEAGIHEGLPTMPEDVELMADKIIDIRGI